MKLQTKIWLSAGAVIASIMAVDLIVGYRHIETELREELENDARVVRGILMATRRVYHEQFMTSGLPVDDHTVGFLPAHAMSKISAQFPQWVETGLRFNNVSDRPRNPANRADAAELAAMAWFRENPAAKDRLIEVRDANGKHYYHFAAPIWIEPYCLKCHGERENAPASIRERYAESYGYKLGDLRGVMSIKLPLDELRAKTLHHWYERFGYRAVGYVGLLLLLGTLMQRMVVRPLKRLEGVAARLEKGDMSARAALPGDDEVASLAGSFNRMAAAIETHDAQTARLNRIYSALSETNQTIVRLDDEAELMRRICHIAVDFGGLSLAWIGKPDASGTHIVVLEFSGSTPDYEEYLRDLKISLVPGLPESRGPTATAWRTGQPQLVQDYFADDTTRPWHHRARPFNWGSCAAFPIVRAGKVALVLNLYHAQAMAFDAKMQDLLAEMAMDIGYALDRIDLIAEQQRIHSELAASEAKFRGVLESSHDGFWLLDATGRLIETNDAYAAFSGYSRAELLGMRVADLAVFKTEQRIEQEMAQVRRKGSDIFESRHRTKSGAIKPVEISVSLVSTETGQFSVFIRDLSQHKAAEARIERLSHFDVLTGLPNRILFADLVRKAIGQAERNHESLALIYIDIDHFKHINDTLGHQVGDQLLVELTERFTRELGSGGTLARMGGDEFLLLLPHADAEAAAHVAERLIEASAQSTVIDGHELNATPSLGIAMYPNDGADFDTLFRKADTATNRAKQEGRSTYRFYTAEMQQRSARTLQLEASLRRAIERKELRLHYQPQVDLVSGRIVGMEALIRWQHPELGLVSPAEFIPIAESSGLILPIGEWVLRTALRDLKALIDQALPINLVAVNLSAVQFRQQDLPGVVARILIESGLPPSCLELELTESLTMENPVEAIAMMNALHRQGIRLSIDDFGTGYSSLNYLKRFPIDKLKIDQSFVRDLTHDPEGGAIVDAIVKLAATLRFKTIAEGVETIEQIDYLRGCHCDELQGYFYSRPLPFDQLSVWLREWGTRRGGA